MSIEGAVIAAFSQETVSRLTGVTKRQLGYWDRTGFFVPGLGRYERGRGDAGLYSFRDVVSLKVLNALRNDARVSLPHLREVKETLAHLGDALWSKTTLYVVKGRVAFVNPETATIEEIVSGQGVLQIPLDKVTGETRKAVEALMVRDPATIGRVERRHGVAGNQPVIAGTRIPVRSIKAFADAGYNVEQIRKEYPTLTADDINVALISDQAA